MTRDPAPRQPAESVPAGAICIACDHPILWDDGVRISASWFSTNAHRRCAGPFLEALAPPSEEIQ